MLTIVAFFAKFSIMQRLGQVLAFTIKHWQAFLVLAICLYAFSQKRAYDAKNAEFEAHIKQDEIAALQARKIIEAKQNQHEIDTNRIIETYQTEIEMHKLDNAQLSEKLKGKKNEIQLALNTLAYQLRQPASADSMLPTQTDTKRTAETERTANATTEINPDLLNDVVKAGQACQFAYEGLYNYCEAELAR